MRSPSPFSACELSDIEVLPDLHDSVRSALVLPPPGHWARGSLGSVEGSSGESEDERPHPLPRRGKVRHRSRSRFPTDRRPPIRRRLSVRRHRRHTPRADAGMANLGGNHDGTVSGDAGADAAACDNGGLDLVQRLDDAVLPLGRNGGNDMLSPAFGVNGAHPYYGPGYVPSAGGNGRLEHQIVPTSQLAAEVNQRTHGGQTGPLDQLRGMSVHERLGPHVGFNHNPETGAFHTPPGLPPGAGYGHAPTAPLFPLPGEMPLDCLFPQPGGLPPVHRLLGGLQLPRIRTPCKRWQPPSKLTWHTQSKQAFGTICRPRGGPLSPPTLPRSLSGRNCRCCPPRTGSPSRTGSPPRSRSPDGGYPTAGICPPPPAYQMPPPPAAPYAGAPVPAPPVFGGPFFRTGFDYTRLQMPDAPVPPAPRQRNANKRSAGNSRGPRGPRSLRCFTLHNTGACADGAACPYVKGHKPCPCGDTRVHAPGACLNNPRRNAASADRTADNSG
jgi:hypothetical protein